MSIIGSSTNQNNMKGLQMFIADLRATQRVKEHENRINSELINIRKQFDNPHSINGYQRKKYVAKLVYIYIITNTSKLEDLEFGLDQVINLLQSITYSEKYMAYMSLGLFIHYKPMIKNYYNNILEAVKNDLKSDDENIAALALNFIGVSGNCLDYNLAQDVFQILHSPVTPLLLKRKSALALLVLLRSNSDILVKDDQTCQFWIHRIMALLDDDMDCGLMLSVLPLLEFISKNIDPAACIKLIPQLAQTLYNYIITFSQNLDSLSEKHKLSDIPNPWLITELVSLLNVLIMSPIDPNSHYTSSNIDPYTLGKLRSCVTKAIDLSSSPVQNHVMKTIKNTILFSLINFASKLDPSKEATTHSVTALCSLLVSIETNTRYLTLDSLVKLCSINGKIAQDTLRSDHMSSLFQLLKYERDSLIIRKLLDLFYILTDSENLKFVVDQLLKYFKCMKQIDHTIRNDLSIKIAILIEKYAQDLDWFVLSSLELLSLTQNTSLNDNNIWQRLCQIVVNNQSLHQLTCSHLVNYLTEDDSSESIIKSGAFLLGEYGHLVSDKISAGDLFNLFTNKYFQCTNVAKAMILTMMIKLYKQDPNISSAVIKFFQLEINSLDIELQTRSYEYLKIIQNVKMNGENMKLLDVLFCQIPPFDSKRNPLLSRLGILTDTNPTDISLKFSPQSSSSSDCLPSLPPTRKNRNPYLSIQLTSNWQEGFQRMLLYKQGVFYLNSLIKILYRTQLKDDHPFLSSVTITYVNISEWPITTLLTEITSFRTDNNPPYVVQSLSLPESTLKPKSRTTHVFEVLTRYPFSIIKAPILSLQFKCGDSINKLKLKLGYGIISTIICERNQVTLPQFIQRWKTIGEKLDKQGEYHSDITVNDGSCDNIVSKLNKLEFDLVDSTTIPNTLFFSAILHTKSEGNFGCLMKIRCSSKNISVSCRTTAGSELSQNVIECIEKVTF